MALYLVIPIPFRMRIKTGAYIVMRRALYFIVRRLGDQGVGLLIILRGI